MTGSGKTGLSMVLLAELVQAGVPAIAVVPKGDLGLVFPRLAPDELARKRALVIERIGRLHQRDPELGRDSTPEQLAFLHADSRGW